MSDTETNPTLCGRAFRVFTISGVQYLAVPCHANSGAVHVIDENGGNHGAWGHFDRFRKHAESLKKNGETPQAISRATVSARTHDEPAVKR